MASGTADLQRDLGGAVMQSSSGSCLWVAGTAICCCCCCWRRFELAGFGEVWSTLEQLRVVCQFEAAARQYPQYTDAIVAASKTFLQGGWACGGILAIA